MSGSKKGLKRTIALVGMMGAGKTSVGRRLAARLGVSFRDADHEIEQAAGCTISDIFERYGEPAFRDGERRVIARLLSEVPHVLAVGGGAYIDGETRGHMKDQALTIWIKAPAEVLAARVARRDNRPLLRVANPGERLERIKRMLADREPIYSQADLIISSEDGPHSQAVEHVVSVLKERGVYEEP